MDPRTFGNVTVYDPRVEVAFFCLDAQTADDATVTFTGGFLEGVIVEEAEGRSIVFAVRMHLPEPPESIAVHTGPDEGGVTSEVAVPWVPGQPTFLVHRIDIRGVTAGVMPVLVAVDGDLVAAGHVTFAHDLAVPDDLADL